MNISVYDRIARTTNALEAYNGALGKKMDKKGHFFTFVSFLQHEEYQKSYEFGELIKSGGRSELGRKRKRVRILSLFNFIESFHLIDEIVKSYYFRNSHATI